MCSDRPVRFQCRRWACVALSAALLAVAALLSSCGPKGAKLGRPAIEHHRDGDIGLYRRALALRFAPRLYMHAEDPTEISEIIPVFHPERPVIAYHIFLGDDALFAGWGMDIDHEIVWVEYDPVTLKVSDVATYWHRAVLRTDDCVLEAKATGQHPTIFIQWGQHGLLPLGWDDLATVRPRLELLAHYALASTIPSVPGVQRGVDAPIRFRGSWEEYIQFTKEVDVAHYLRNSEILVSEYPDDELRSRIQPVYGKFGRKKEWPWWSP